ncbi:hypothetical protein EXM36_17245 [Clostridium botulinum]|nr:hypothetical protein [Clostridium botulinum]NFA39663.1 hypothetical protein [Clostridium botulinum]NFA75476.1 hypothetical protein [Clostridium botulinum]NFB50932.1 hypothetical protein [Clostridium botulinum]NFD15713.1 hypothetical protein [Clostridium botulinum]
MSKETENLKLFKYDSETDDFNTTTFNVQQALNDNWDKIDLDREDTEKEITTLKEVDEDIYKQLERLQFLTQIANIARYDKDSNGIYPRVVYRVPSGRDGTPNELIAVSQLQKPNAEGKYQEQMITVTNKPTGKTDFYFNLIYSDGEFIQREVSKIVER